MSLAVLAQHMGVSVEELVRMLENKGVKVGKANTPLSIDQKKRIGKALGIDVNSLSKGSKPVAKKEVAKPQERQVVKEPVLSRGSSNTTVGGNNTKNTELESKNVKQIKSKKVFIDTCSILSDDFYEFWNSIEGYLDSSNSKIILTTKVAGELKKLTGNIEVADKAIKAIKFLEGKIRYLDLRGEETDNFADNVFNCVFTKYRIQYELLLITEDKNLSRDILQLNNSRSTNGKKIVVCSINKGGEIKPFVDKEKVHINTGSKKVNDIKNRKKAPSIAKHIDKFKIVTSPTSMTDEVISVKSVPKEGEKVQTSAGHVILGKELARGGEGAVFEFPGNYVCKIYKEECITTRRKAKIERMLSKKINCEGVCWPTEMVYNSHGEFVGYIMPKASGKEIQRSIFFKHLMKAQFPNWKKKDLVQLCITILDKIQYLHDRNIIIGDINPANILVVSSREVYFVDTDSYQIEEFPCPVGMVNYTAPEIQRKRFSEFLRTKGNENFAVATLLFMILVPGKPPYSQQGGGKQIDNVINMNFAYPFQKKSTGAAPEGPWRFIWSHLTFDIKQAFYQTFMKGEERSTEETRISVAEWNKRLTRYYSLLTDGKLEGQDPMSLELFPTELKRIVGADINYVTCSLCKKEKQENYMNQGICTDCLKQEEYYLCKKCGCEMSYSNRQKYIYKAKKHDTCKSCVEKLNSVHSVLRCNDCNSNFDFLQRDYEYYVKQGFTHYPKKCPTCRSKKTSGTSRPVYTQINRPVSRSVNKPTGTSGKKSGFCFITTATCEYFNKPDDCFELETLRDFRDNWLANQVDGKELIKEYYEIAPAIVEAINNKDSKKEIYIEIQSKYLQPCLDLIAENKMEECKALYIEMVKDLKNKY